MSDEEIAKLSSRRDFFKKMLAVGFAVPVVSSFAFDGSASASWYTQHQGNSSMGDLGGEDVGFLHQGTLTHTDGGR